MDLESLRALAEAAPGRYARALAEAVKEIGRGAPPPRGFPFFGLDHPPGCGAKLLDRLSDMGIFRVYEHVLDLGSGLAGPARWLARTRGCRVTGIDPSPARAAAAALLTRRAHLGGQVSLVAAGLDALPFAAGAFTHAWTIESLHREPRKVDVLRAAFRGLRPGGHIAIQDWVADDGSAGERYPPVTAYKEGLAAAGFLDVRVVEADDLREAEDSAIAEVARERVATLARDLADEERETLPAASESIAWWGSERRARRIRLVQVFGRKPT